MTSVESKAETWKGTEELAQQGATESTVELLELLGRVQGGRLEEQRCLFDPKRIPSTPKHTDATTVHVTRPQVDSGSGRGGQGKTATENEADRLCNMLSRVQGSRMDEQRCSAPQVFLAPGSPPPPRKAHSRPASPTATPSSQGPPRSASLSPTPDKERVQRDGLQSAQGVAPCTVEQDQFFSLLSHVQRGCMEEQRCVFNPNKRSTSTPKHTEATHSVPTPTSAADIDQLFSILASTQSRRLDDQRVSLNLLPGLQVVSGSGQDGQGKCVDELCSMVSRVQGSRMDEQRCSAPQVFLAPGSPPPPRKAHSRPASPTATPSSQGPPRSASLSPTPDKERVQKDGLQSAQQGVAPCTVEQDQFFSLLSHVQRGCMEEQRCVFDPNKRSTSTPKHTEATHSVPTPTSAADIDQLFSILASTQSRRLDDQRVSLNLLPGLQVVSGSGQDGQGKSVDELCSMVSRVQGSRMDEQRCSAPQVFLAPGSPPPPRKAHSRPASPTATPSSQGPPRSASLSPTPDKERVQKDGLQSAQQGVAPCTVEQDQFFSLLSHVQRGCMEEQRCVFDPNKRSTSTPKHTEATHSVPTPTSAADIDQLFSILASTQSRRLDDQRVSLNLLPGLQVVSGSGQDGQGKCVDELCSMVSRVQGYRIDEQRCSLPVPLSPVPPRSASMNAVALDCAMSRQRQLLSAPDLAPLRKARSNPSSPSRATPGKSRSRPSSPNRATPRKSRSRPLSPNTMQHVSSPIGPDEDCFSLIHRVHASQLQMGERDKGEHGTEGGKQERGGEKRGRGEGGKREGRKDVEEKERRGKEEARKEKKGGGRKK